MTETVDVKLYFSFRSPYCYLLSKTMWDIVDNDCVNLLWKPVGGWDLRSPPDRAKVKIPLVRQDLARYARRMDIPVNPPPPETEPTPAGAASLYAKEQGKLRQFIIEAMHLEWGEGQNIAEDTALAEVANRIGLDSDAIICAAHDNQYLDELAHNANEAEECGVIGVPTFVIGENIFWGQDRVDFVLEHLQEITS